MINVRAFQDDPNKRLTIVPLMNAVKNNKIDLVRNSLTRYGLPNSGTKNTDYLALQTALSRRYLEMAKLLINAGCRVNKKINDDNTKTPLEYAISMESEELVALLLDKGAKLSTGESASVLHYAVDIQSLKMMKFFLNRNVNINLINHGKTAFQVFLEKCHRLEDEKNRAIVKLFLDKGALIYFKSQDGQTLLHYIVKTNKIDLIRSVLQVTQNVNEQDKNKNTALHSLLNVRNVDLGIADIAKLFILKGAKVDIQNNNGDTTLHLAARNKQLEVLQILMQCQWNLNCCNNDGNTVLHLLLHNSSSYSKSKEFLRTVNAILKQKNLKLKKNKQGETPLHFAAVNRQTGILNNMLSTPAIVEQNSGNDVSVLYIFMKSLVGNVGILDNDDIEIIKKMIARGDNPTLEHHQTKQTPLHFAVNLANREIIMAMLDCPFDYDKFEAWNRGSSILHFLCYHDASINEDKGILMAEVAEVCIKKGATVDKKDTDLKTPLYLAVSFRHKHMVKILLEYGADPNLCDMEGRTILENLMKKSVFQGYSRNLVTIYSNIDRDSEIAQMLLFKKADPHKITNGQQSLFHYCAVNSYLDMLLKIIPYCKDANIRDPQEVTILHALLCENANKNEDTEKKVAEIVAILLSKGAKINVVTKKNETSLHLAIKGRNFKAAKILFQHNCSVTDVDSDGNSVLHFLCMSQSKSNDSVEKELTELFVSKGCDVNAKNNNDITPLMLAAEYGASNVFDILLQLGADMNYTIDENLSMPIHLAAKHNRFEIIEKIVNLGIDVNIRRKDRKTALHLSVAHKLSQATKFLLENGADTDMKDDTGKTPLHWACWYESLDNINELLDYGADVNAEDNLQVTPLMLTRQSKITWTKLRYHVIKLEIANMPVSARNKVFIEKSIKDHPRNHANTPELNEFESAATEETLKMENVSIAPRTTLADVLQMSANKLSVFKCNEDFQKLLYSDDFKKNYPIYADLVRACYRKGIIRSDLILSTKDAFRKILGMALPDTCCDAIFNYLDNENLHNLEKAAKIRNVKRKRFLDEINECIPAKRVRRISV